MKILRSTMAPLLLATLLTAVPAFAMQDSSTPAASSSQTDSQKKQLKANQKADKAKANAAKQQQKAMDAQDKAAKDSQKATANH